MTRVLIASASYGFQNVGDDAILAAMVEHLRTLPIEIEITAVTREPERMAERLGIPAIEFLGLAPRLRTYLEVARNDVVIVGGGALIAEYTKGWRGLVTGHPGYPMTMVATAKLLGKRAMVYGAGVERIESRAARFFVKHVFDRADVITLRDEDSKQRLTHELGLSRAPIHATADPVLGLSLPTESKMDSFVASRGLDDPSRPLVVINFAYGIDKRNDLLDFVARCAEHVIARWGARVLFVPMNLYATTDRRGMELVLDRMEDTTHASILDLPYAHEEVLAIARRADLVISSRMHLLILSALVGTPIVGLSRVPKVDAYLAHYGLQAAGRTDQLDFDDFAEKLDRTWRERGVIRDRLRAEAPRLAELARSNATHLETILR
ncbi:MAG: polysaccharide pyruvyl transferase family protein [Myxococcota bacterium]